GRPRSDRSVRPGPGEQRAVRGVVVLRRQRGQLAAHLMPPDAARDDIVGADPVLASPFPLGEVAATALAASGRAAAALWALRTGEAQRVRVDVGAAAASLLGFALQ